MLRILILNSAILISYLARSCANTRYLHNYCCCCEHLQFRISVTFVTKKVLCCVIIEPVGAVERAAPCPACKHSQLWSDMQAMFGDAVQYSEMADGTCRKCQLKHYYIMNRCFATLNYGYSLQRSECCTLYRKRSPNLACMCGSHS